MQISLARGARMNVVIRNVEKKAFWDFKVKCVEAGMTIGRAASEAFAFWARLKERKARKSILDFKPVNLGKGTEKGIVLIDELAFSD